MRLECGGKLGMPMKILVVGNPVSGSGRGRRLMEKASDVLGAAGHELTVVATEGRGDAREAAGEITADTVVCVGGDGTVNEVVTGLSGRATPVAVIPAGTANVLVRELGLPRTVEDVSAAVSGGREVHLDSCIAGGNRFLLAAGAGFDASVVHRLAAVRGGTSSYFAYALPIVRSWLRYAPEPCTVEVDGSAICDDAALCVVANVGNGRWKMLPEADPRDGVVDIIAFRSRGKLSLASFALSFVFQRHTSRRDVTCGRGTRVRLFSTNNGRVPVHMDGDPAGHLPLEVTVDPGSVRVVVPAEGAS
jgi:diacylglycerol kinase (ATP)